MKNRTLEELCESSYVSYMEVSRLSKEDRIYLLNHGNHYVVDYDYGYDTDIYGAFLDSVMTPDGEWK